MANVTKFCKQKSAIISAFFNKKIEIRERPSFRLWIPNTVQSSALCKSRRELSNEYLLAKFGFDTAENEPSKVRPIPRGEAIRVLRRVRRSSRRPWRTKT